MYDDHVHICGSMRMVRLSAEGGVYYVNIHLCFSVMLRKELLSLIGFVDNDNLQYFIWFRKGLWLVTFSELREWSGYSRTA
uniref:Uncharacterized protein n=1 Tax=Manihot esculenta TaxID=3983 RepID=A0A2C9WPY3_MANES